MNERLPASTSFYK